ACLMASTMLLLSTSAFVRSSDAATPPTVVETEADLVETLETNQLDAQPKSEAQMEPSEATLPALELAQLSKGDDLGQVTSVSQLSDVRPTDWAFQALQSLVERYGCIAGYPNGTFRGNRSATRYEMAAALNACLDQISDRFASKADLDAVKALQDEFAAELATLRGRVDGLESRVATVEAQQFSTTTKLSGIASFVAQYGDTTGDGFINPATGLPTNTGTTRASAISAVILDFNTSFTGSDLLQTSLFTGNNGADAAVGLGLDSGPNFVTQGSNALTFYPSNVGLFRLAYTFSPLKDVSLTVGPKLYPNDFLDFNTYANNPFGDFQSFFFTNNPLIITFPLNLNGGAGGGMSWNPSGGPFTARAAYIAGSGNQATATPNNGGLFGDPYQATAELEYSKSFGSNDQNNVAVRLQYTNSATFDFAQDAIGVNAEATFGQFGVFGRYGYSFASLYGTTGDNANFNAQTWMAGAGVKDLLVEGSMLGAAVGQPLITNLPATNSFGANSGTQTNIEAFFRLPVGDNISVTPSITFIDNAGNISGQPLLIQGGMRATFTF
ncbi:MAG: iron uptake porin, partial [Thermosynechococcaceae cyanobacterium]